MWLRDNTDKELDIQDPVKQCYEQQTGNKVCKG